MRLTNAKGLAQARRNLIEKVRQASGTGVKVFERSMNSDLQVPSRTRGLSFLSALSLFIAFLVVLTYEVIKERAPLVSNQVQTAVVGMYGNFSGVGTRAELIEYLTFGLPSSAIQQSRSGNMRRVGSIRIRQIRTVSTCSADSLWLHYVGGTSPAAESPSTTSLHLTCASDVTSADVINRSAVVGPRSGLVFPFHAEVPYCTWGFCSIDLPSTILDTVAYPYEGNVLFMSNGVFLSSNGSALIETPAPTTTTVVPSSGGNGTTTMAPTNSSSNNDSDMSSSNDDGDRSWLEVQDIMEDFLQDDTRFVQVETTFYTPSTHTATSALLNFECPASGGVFPYVAVQSSCLFDTNHPRCIFLWFYVVLQFVIQLYALIQSLRHTFDCATCSQSNTLIVFKCIKCKSPCELCIGRVSLCGSCGTPVPSLGHSCWRSMVTDIWRIITILSVSSLVVSRIASTASIKDISDLVGDSAVGAPSGQITEVVSIAAFFSVYRQGISTLLVTIICTYIRLFHYVGRGQFGSQFARVLQYSITPLASFSVNFMVAYSGFCFALHLAGGSSSINFATLPNTYLTSFRFLLSQVGWSELGTITPSILLLLVLFFIVCLCLMFNVFPSVLSVSYKKAARTPYYDVDVLSSWLLLKRYVLVPLGVINRKRSNSKSPRRRSNTATTMNSEMLDGGGGSQSDHDDRSSVHSNGRHSAHNDVADTTAQIDALRSGEEIEDLLAHQELKGLNRATDDLAIHVVSQEESLRTAVKNLNDTIRDLAKVLGPVMEDYMNLVEQRRATSGGKKGHVASSGPHSSEASRDDDATDADSAALREVRLILAANAERLELFTSHLVALPAIEDSSLLEPICAPPAPFEPSECSGDGIDGQNNVASGGAPKVDPMIDDDEELRTVVSSETSVSNGSIAARPDGVLTRVSSRSTIGGRTAPTEPPVGGLVRRSLTAQSLKDLASLPSSNSGSSALAGRPLASKATLNASPPSAPTKPEQALSAPEGTGLTGLPSAPSFRALLANASRQTKAAAEVKRQHHTVVTAEHVVDSDDLE